MLEAKDTVMTEEEAVGSMDMPLLPEPVRELWWNHTYKMLLAQAGISFKAGERKVAEWVEENSYGFDIGDGVMIRKMDDELWQAKWGLNEGQ